MPPPEHIGRIRVNEEEARVLYRMLVAERMRYLLDRRIAKMHGVDLRYYQRQLHHIKNLYEETLLLADQKEWDLGEPVPVYEEGTDPSTPPGPSERVGGWDRTDYGRGRGVRGATTSP